MQYSPEQQPVHAAVPEIVIYHNRTQVMRLTMILAVSTAFSLILFLPRISFIFTLYTRLQLHPVPTSLAVGLILFGIFACLVFIFAIWATIWQFIQILRPTPQLIINQQGITIGRRALYSGAFIPWHEIDEICAYQTIRTYLGIRPRDTRQFLQRIDPITSYSMRRSLLFGYPPLYILQAFLERPVQEVVKQIEVVYAQELKAHNIQVSS